MPPVPLSFLVHLGEAATGTTIVAVPPAGAGAEFFHPWSSTLGSKARLLAVRLPGRGELWEEDPVENGPEILARLTEELRADQPGDVVVLGICTGGLLAYELAHRLLREDIGRVAGLVFNGTMTPHAAVKPPYVCDSSDEWLRDYYEQFETEPFPDELWEMTEPRIRADLAAVEHMSYTQQPLDLPVIHVRGEADESPPQAELLRWADFTTRPVEIRTLPGGHALMDDNPAGFANELARVLGQHCRPDSRSALGAG